LEQAFEIWNRSDQFRLPRDRRAFGTTKQRATDKPITVTATKIGFKYFCIGPSRNSAKGLLQKPDVSD